MFTVEIAMELLKDVNSEIQYENSDEMLIAKRIDEIEKEIIGLEDDLREIRISRTRHIVMRNALEMFISEGGMMISDFDVCEEDNDEQ